MTASSSATFPKHSITFWSCFVAILLLAGLFRFLPIRSGLPYSDYVDEGHILHQTIDAFNRKSLDVYWYGLPALPAYSTAVALIFYGPFYRYFHGHGFRADLPDDPSLPSSKFDYDLITPPELIVAGRFVTACLSMASVVLAGMIAMRLANVRAGLLAMLLMAICPALVTRGSIVIVDTFATFFALVVLNFCLRIQEANPVEAQHPVRSWIWRSVFLAGLVTGLVFASKYPVASVGAAVVATILTLGISWQQRVRLILLMLLGILLGILLGAPMTFIKPMTVWHDALENIRAYSEIHSPQGYVAQAVSMSELGLPLLLIGFAGIVLLFAQRSSRLFAFVWILFATVLIALFMRSSFRPFRSFLSLVPLLCIAAGIAFSNLTDWAKARATNWWRVGLVVVMVAGTVGQMGFSSFRQVNKRMTHRDSRLQAIDWLERNVGKGETILALNELAILPSEWKRVAAKVTIVPWQEASGVLERERFDHLVTGEFDLRHSANSRTLAAYRTGWESRVAHLPVEAEFGQVGTPVVPYVWRTNDLRILVLRGDAH